MERVLGGFAHNEAGHIEACPEGILHALGGTPISIFAFANGCRNKTAELTRSFARRRESEHVVEPAEGGKTSSWNRLAHEFAPRGDTCSCLTGNRYASHGSFIERLLQRGLLRDDNRAGTLESRKPYPQGSRDATRSAPCLSAQFRYPPALRTLLRSLSQRWRRKFRYSVRHFQPLMPGSALPRDGLASLPGTVSELYARADISTLKPHLHPRMWLWNVEALAHVRAALAVACDAQRCRGQTLATR